VTEKNKPPPAFSAFKNLLEKLVKVPKAEIDEQEREYQRQREAERRTKKRA
jgi:hypothetical protein